MTFDHSNKVHRATADCSMGRLNFVAMTGQDAPERQNMLASILAKIDEEKLEVVRVAFVDTHGIVRIRPIEARLFSQAIRNGVPFTTALLAMDSANSIFQNVFARDGGFGRDTMGGAGDMLAIPDLSTFRVLPWAHKCAWVVSDLYLLSGERCPLRSPSDHADRLRAAGRQQGFTYVGGVEVECHILKITDPRNDLADCTQPSTPPSVEAAAPRLPIHVGERPRRTGADHHAHSSRTDRCRLAAADRGSGVGASSDRNIARSHGEHGSRGRGGHLAGAVKQVCRRMGLLAILHDKARAAERVFEWLASASVAVSHREREKCLRRTRRLCCRAPACTSSVACSSMHERAPLSQIRRSMATSVCNANPLAPKRSRVVARQQGCDVPAGRRHG